MGKITNQLPDWYPLAIHRESVPLPVFYSHLCALSERAAQVSLFAESGGFNTPFKRYKTAQRFGRWRYYKVVDYLDLMVWSVESGTPLERSFLARYFWPFDEVNIYRRLTKGTHPLAVDLLNTEAIECVRSVSLFYPTKHI